MPSEIRLVPHYSRENRKQRRKLKIPSFPRRRESGISMPQEFIGKNQNPSAVIPAQAGIWNFNASRIYRKKPKPFRRHSHESGNLEMKSNG
ncbi:hypothetical protein, partial [Neisseria gonorrhoeae]